MKPYFIQRVEIKSLPAEVKNNEKESMKSGWVKYADTT
jgi:hypothetical protein